jgi:hypothetical protein
MRVICTTVIRGADQFDLSGRIIEMDLPSGEIIVAMNLPNKGNIIGPRGGSRGGRGVRVFNNKIYVAIYDRILVYDLNWNLLSEIQHPHVVGHHEIQVDAQGIWCCSTMIDAVVKLDFSGKVLFEWWASEDNEFLAWVKARKFAWDRDIDYSTYAPHPDKEGYPNHQFHINSIYYGIDGKVYAYDLNYAALFVIWPRFEPVARNPAWGHAHNVCLYGRDILVNASAFRSFEIWRMPEGWQRFWNRKPYRVQNIVIVPGKGESTQFSKSGWVRGRIDLGPNEFIVGCNPASLYHLQDGHIVQRWQISSQVNEAVHGLTVKSV